MHGGSFSSDSMRNDEGRAKKLIRGGVSGLWAERTSQIYEEFMLQWTKQS